MRYVKLFLLEFQSVFEQRAVTFVWFILSIFGPVIMILFWRGASTSATNWTFSIISSYYLILMISQALLMSHVEENIARLDIQEGRLSQYLLKPFSYYWFKFLTEIPWRVLQAVFGIITFFAILFIFNIQIQFVSTFLGLLLSIIIAVLAYFIAFTYKMVLAFLAFWLVDIGGFFQLSEMLIFLLGGYIVPLRLYPDIVARVAYFTPFPYIIYYPVVAFQGILSSVELLKVIGIQIIFLSILIFFCRFIWGKGIREFTGIGQ